MASQQQLLVKVMFPTKELSLFMADFVFQGVTIKLTVNVQTTLDLDLTSSEGASSQMEIIGCLPVY